MTKAALRMTKAALRMTKAALRMTKAALRMTKTALGMTNWVLLECLMLQRYLDIAGRRILLLHKQLR